MTMVSASLLHVRTRQSPSSSSSSWLSIKVMGGILVIGFVLLYGVMDQAWRYAASSSSNGTQSKTLSDQGLSGGAWTWCTHIKRYGFNFDLGLASFLAFQLKPQNAFEFGSGIGLYAEYLVRHGRVTGSVLAVEPEDMSSAGVFGQDRPYPKQITGYILDASRKKERDALGKFDLVYSIEVAEHVPANLRPDLIQFLSSITGKYLVFSAARPGQGGTGHIRESSLPRDEWIDLWTKAGLVYLPQLSTKLLAQCDEKNSNHGKNVIVMGTSADLDTDQFVPELKRTEGTDETVAFELFPDIKEATDRGLVQCS